MMILTIHLNGTSARDLLNQWGDAYVALTQAIDTIGKAAPNGRDYYLQGPGALDQASDEHRSRITRILEVAEEYVQMANEVQG